MLITKKELEKYSGVYRDNNDTLGEVYIGSATDIVDTYLGYVAEQNEDWKKQVLKIVYSVDMINFYADEERTELVEIPDGAEITATGIENQYSYIALEVVVPDLIRLTCLRIASLLQQEEEGNIGINNKSYGESGSRSFLNVVNYDKYLAQIARYRHIESHLGESNG